MPHPIRSFLVAGSLVVLSTALAACGSSGDSEGASSGRATTTTAEATTTTEAPAATTTADGTVSTTAGTTATTAADGSVDCQAFLQEYAEVFDPEDLAATVAFFRHYEPSMPDDVAEATERLAVAYEKAGDLGHMDMSSVDLTADAQTFSDWTNDGCPVG